jgi:hypothetical protein
VNENLSPTLAHLRTFPKVNKDRSGFGNPKAKLSRHLAQRFCDLIAESDQSVFELIKANPDFPSFKRLYNFQQRVPWFADMWREARIRQTHFLAHQCIKLYSEVCPKTAHVVRVKFDILKWFCAKFNPETFGDRPPQQGPVQTVNIGVSISPDRLSELRSKLDNTRSVLAPKTNASTLEKESRTHRGNGVKALTLAKRVESPASNTP